MYANRAEAGRQLAGRLGPYKNQNPAVIALPRGGIPVAFEVAQALQAPLDIVMVRKLGYPGQPELAIGAIVDGDDPEIFLNRGLIDDRELPSHYLEDEIGRKRTQIGEVRAALGREEPGVSLAGRTVIVVDDGVATGATMRVVLQRLRRRHAGLIVAAAPVASREAVRALGREADAWVCPLVPDFFGAVGNFYEDFSPVGDDEARELLERSEKFAPKGNRTPASALKGLRPSR